MTTDNDDVLSVAREAEAFDHVDVAHPQRYKAQHDLKQHCKALRERAERVGRMDEALHKQLDAQREQIDSLTKRLKSYDGALARQDDHFANMLAWVEGKHKVLVEAVRTYVELPSGQAISVDHAYDAMTAALDDVTREQEGGDAE